MRGPAGSKLQKMYASHWRLAASASSTANAPYVRAWKRLLLAAYPARLPALRRPEGMHYNAVAVGDTAAPLWTFV